MAEAIIGYLLYPIGYAALAIELYGGYIFLASIFLYSNAQAKAMARHARRTASAMEGRKDMVCQPITNRRTLYGINRVSGPI